MKFGLILSVFVLLTAGRSSAVPLTWYLSAKFDDGGTVSGSFVYDADTNVYSNIAISTTGGSRQDASYRDLLVGGSFLFIAVPHNPQSWPQLIGLPALNLGFSVDLSNSGGTVALSHGYESTCGGDYCTPIDMRFLNGASVTTTAPPVQPPPSYPPSPYPPPDQRRPVPLSESKLGVFRKGAWKLDKDGDGFFSDVSDGLFRFGFTGGNPLVGDWNGDGFDEVGAYVNLFGSVYWILDLDGDEKWNPNFDKAFVYGWGSHAQPIVGDWNGDGADEIGIYANGLWLLDIDGDGQLTRNDAAFVFGGWDGAVPLVGDWAGLGKDSVGIYVEGYWCLDYSGDRIYDVNAGDRLYKPYWKGPVVTPLVGDWNGDGRTKVGFYRSGRALLDMNGDGIFGGIGEQPYFLGPHRAVPAVGDWNRDGVDTIAAIEAGVWHVDKNGDQIHNGNDPIYFWGDDWVAESIDEVVLVPGHWKPRSGP